MFHVLDHSDTLGGDDKLQCVDAGLFGFVTQIMKRQVFTVGWQLSSMSFNLRSAYQLRTGRFHAA